MKKIVYKIDEKGFLLFGEEVFIEPTYGKSKQPIYVIPQGYIDIPLPTDEKGWQLPFYRPRWKGTEWVEDMPQSEIDELNKPIERPLSDLESLGQQMTERELEASAQGQQLTDIELILAEMGVSKNV